MCFMIYCTSYALKKRRDLIMGIRFVTKVLACFFIGAFALAAGGNYAVSADFPKVMNVGLVTEMTGNWSWAGKWKSQAAAMAIDELNASLLGSTL
jgi:ABC-type branched-subunit amino acid transport system substrate-binding protein